MIPAIRDGDMVEIVPATIEQVGVGNVVVFRTGRRLLAHRVVRRTTEGQRTHLVTRGDNLLDEDGTIRDAADLIGVVTAVCRGGRRIQLDKGLSGYKGRLVARSKTAHLIVYRAIRLWWRIHRWIGGFLAHSRNQRDGASAGSSKGAGT